MSRSQRIAAFEAWLRERGSPEDVATFNRSVVDGFVVLAGAGPVGPEHVEQGLKLAGEAGMVHVEQMQRLGALFLQFEAAQAAAPPRSEPPSAAPPTAAPPRSEPPPAEAAPSAEENPRSLAPLVVKLRAATKPPEPAAAEEPSSVPPSTPAARPRRRRGLAIAGVAVAVAATAGALLLRGGAPAPEPVAAKADPPRPAPLQRLRRVQLAARFPAGWREATDQELAADEAAPTALVFRGAAPTDPEQGVFIATLPLAAELAGSPTDEALLAATRTAERGVAARLASDAGSYEPAGCSILTVAGQRAGACRGAALHGGELASLETYVRLVGGKEVVALFMAKRSVRDPHRDAADIVSSFAP